MLLCFGDSNTWGFRPEGGRYPAELRWPDRLARGLNLPLMADGRPGRTLCHENLQAGLSSGKADWQAALGRQPAKVVLALGINDLAAGATLATLHQALCQYLELWRQLAPASRLVLLAPAPLGRLQGGWRALFGDQETTSRQLVPLWQQVAAEYGVTCLDPTPLLALGGDGLHWSREEHGRVAEALLPLLA